MKTSYRSIKALSILLGIGALAVGLVTGLHVSAQAQGGPGGAPPPPPEVAVLEVHQEPTTLTTELPGRVSPHLVADVRPQVNGIVTKRHFTEGGMVKEGDVLYEIDPAPYQAAFDTAVAALARAEANVRPIELRVGREKDLVPKGAVSQQSHDEVLAMLKQAKAEVAYSEAAVAGARVNLNYTKIKAPITGRIGRSSVTVGALATAHQGPAFATIQQLDPIYVDVTQSTAQLQKLRKHLKEGEISRDEANASKVKLIIEDGAVYPHEGELQFRDVTVDPTTGSVILRALFPNPDEDLLPGMFVRAVISEGLSENAILVPQQAVMRNPKGDPMVMLVNAEGKAEQRMITVDRTIGAEWLVQNGLEPGERVIVEGLQKVRPDAVVKPVPWEEHAPPAAAPAEASAPAAEAK